MIKQVVIAGGVAAAVFLAAVQVGTRVSAQGNLAHGIPQPEKIYGDGVTWPIKIDVNDYDMARINASNGLTADQFTGRVLWLQKCAYCHDGVGQPTYRTMGPWLGAETIDKLGESNVRSFIYTGDVRMPAFRYSLSDHQIDQVLAFLKTVPSDTKPTAAQLAGRQGTVAASD